VDPGTFAYNAPGGWRHSLRTALVHNGPLLDDADPAMPGPRFLWLRWPEARLEAINETSDGVVIEASRRKAVRRTVRIRPGQVEVEDESLDPEARELVARWLLHHDATREQLIVDSPTRTLEAAESGGGPGWYAPAYGLKIPSRIAEARVSEGAGALRIRTVLDSVAVTVPGESEETVDAATTS